VSDTKADHIGIRVTVEQKARLKAAADDVGLPLSVWLLTIALHVTGDPSALRLIDHLNRARSLRQAGSAP